MSAEGSVAGLRMALVGPLPPPAGGMANQTRQLAELLRAAGAEVDLVPTNPPFRPAWVGKLPVLRAGVRLAAYVLRLWRAAGRAQLLHVMANSGWSWHLFAVPAIWVARARGVPVVVNYRGGGAADFLARSQRQVRFSMRQVAALIVPSGFLVNVFQRFGIAAEIVPNILDLARFRPADAARPGAAARQGGPRSQVVVARNLEAIYDNATAIQAFALLRQRLPGALLTVAGSGPEAGRLQALVLALGMNDAVRFTGTLDRDAMAALYATADVSLNPSLTDNSPNSVLESMASGVPVVSTDVGGVPFILEDGRTGLLVPPGDAQAMAAALYRLLTDEALWQSLVTASQAEVQRYAWPQVAARLLGVYRRAIKPLAGTP